MSAVHQANNKDVCREICLVNKKKAFTFSKVLRYWELYVFMLPGILYFIIFHYMPMYGIQIAFKEFVPARGILGSEWVGLEHFKSFFSSFYFWRLVKNTLLINVYNLIFGFPIPILLALMLNEAKNGMFKKSVQLVTYAPHFISMVVMVGMMYVFLNTERGFINNILAQIGFERINFMGNAEFFRPVYVSTGIWQTTGWGAIIYLGVLSGVDPCLHESAVIDGATRLQRVIHINVPVIMPTAVILFILNVGQMLNVGFEKALLMQNPGNISASEVISTYVYRLGILQGQYSFTSAVGFLNSVCNVLLLLGVNAIVSSVNDTSLF